MFITEANYTKRGQIINTLNSALWFFRKCIITLKLHPSQITNPNCLCTDSIPTLPRGPCCLLYLCTFLLCLALQPPSPFLEQFCFPLTASIALQHTDDLLLQLGHPPQRSRVLPRRGEAQPLRHQNGPCTEASPGDQPYPKCVNDINI